MDITSEHSSLLEDDIDACRFASVLAENVKRLRKQAHISKTTFALMIGIGRPFLNKIENGTADPRLSIITKMADALETTPEYLLTKHHTLRDSSQPIPRTIHHARLQ